MEDSANQHPEEMKIIDLRPRPRYVMDFSVPSYHLPVPTQVCFFTGNPAVIRTQNTLRLVEIMEIGPQQNYNEIWSTIKVRYRILNVDDGHPTGTSDNTLVHVKAGMFKYGFVPTFMNAIDRWANAPDARQAYADVLDVFEHGFGLINAKYLDYDNEMANINATLARLVPSTDAKTADVHHVQ